MHIAPMGIHVLPASHGGHHEQYSPFQSTMCKRWDTPKKAAQTPITSLEKAEMDALLGAPDRRTAQGRRDYGLLLFLYNTGARADEAAHLRIRELWLGQGPQREPSSVELWGKGKKRRGCPLWPHTASELTTRIEGREP